MRDVLAIIPARVGSKGIPNKNFRPLAGVPPLIRAVGAAHGLGTIVITTDKADLVTGGSAIQLYAPAPLHTDTCPMIDVIQDVLARVPGPPEQIIVLVQPTQPLRQSKHLTAAIELLQSSGADSVVSVVELPLTQSPDYVCLVDERGRLRPWPEWEGYEECRLSWDQQPRRRQDAKIAHMRDGTVYAFWRRTVAKYGDIYGSYCYPLIMDPEETCPLDTLADWAEAERRLLVPA